MQMKSKKTNVNMVYKVFINAMKKKGGDEENKAGIDPLS